MLGKKRTGGHIIWLRRMGQPIVVGEKYALRGELLEDRRSSSRRKVGIFEPNGDESVVDWYGLNSNRVNNLNSRGLKENEEKRGHKHLCRTAL